MNRNLVDMGPNFRKWLKERENKNSVAELIKFGETDLVSLHLCVSEMFIYDVILPVVQQAL